MTTELSEWNTPEERTRINDVMFDQLRSVPCTEDDYVISDADYRILFMMENEAGFYGDDEDNTWPDDFIF